MARRFTEAELVLASHNAGKVREIRALLAPYGIAVLSAGDLGLPEPEETGTTFAANAELKAHAATAASGKPALADDSGLAVDLLDGDPGIYSARWAGPERDFRLAMETVWQRLHDKGAHSPLADTDRRAHFVAALSLAWPDGHCETVEGRVYGTLVWPPRGDKGFGYDPMFVPEGYDITFGEMDPDRKHDISHRADAFRKLTAACFGGG
jgi:XTP/dITP diphosphohydrolase